MHVLWLTFVLLEATVLYSVNDKLTRFILFFFNDFILELYFNTGYRNILFYVAFYFSIPDSSQLIFFSLMH